MIECFGLSDKGCVRSNNEDYFEVAPELGLAVLADGMGGARAGETASLVAVETVMEAMRAAESRDARALLDAMQRANQQVLAMAKADPELQGMGTTLVCLLDQGEEVLVASVGDSRAYFADGGSLRPLTEDQSWVNEVGRLMGLDSEALKSHPLRHVLTMAIGATSNLAINCYRRDWKPGSTLLLCSDGLHGAVPAAVIEQIVPSNGDLFDLEGVCHRLIEAAREAGGPDNITAVLARRIG